MFLVTQGDQYMFQKENLICISICNHHVLWSPGDFISLPERL